MQFQTLQLGNLDTSFGATTSARLPFSFPTPVTRVHALLKSFHLSRDGSDMDLGGVQVSLIVLFDGFQSTTDGQIQVEVRYKGSTSGFWAWFWGIWISPVFYRFQVQILVIGS